jgi:hypothetical protein
MRRRLPLAATFALCLSALPASAQVDAQIAELNSEALEAYQNLDIENALGKLQQAITTAEQSGYAGPELAVTYLNLGVVYTSGLNDREQGLAAFVSAICAQPGIELDPLLSAPEAQEVFVQAQQQAASGACPPPPPGTAPPVYPQPFMPQHVPSGPQEADRECPPGMKCDDGFDDGSDEPDDKPFSRLFVQLGFALGFALVQSGMEADSDPTLDDIILEAVAVDISGDGMIDDTDLVGGVDYDGNGGVDNRYYFDDTSAWVPDSDSYDDYEVPGDIPRGTTPVSTQCAADGKRTGPLSGGIIDQETSMPFADYVPSKYCVRVEQAGVVMNPALRLAPGYFIADTFALSLPIRFQFSAGEGSLSHMLVGLRGELLFSRMESATGFPVSWFFGFTAGQIQAKPPPKDPSRPAPYVISGPVGGHTGIAVRWRFDPNWGAFIAPEVDVMFPNFLLNTDLTLGIEAAF